MTSSNGNGERRTVASLRDLPRSIEPARDLWPQIEARLAAEPAPGSRIRRASSARGRLLAAAAVLASLAVGVWIGRDLLPAGGPQAVDPWAMGPNGGRPAVLRAALIADPRYLEQRAALVRSLESQLEQLPPESRMKVVASLAAIRQSMRDLEDALGSDPSNSLLQELLVNTYQDEMRVLTTVHEAGTAAEDI